MSIVWPIPSKFFFLWQPLFLIIILFQRRWFPFHSVQLRMCFWLKMGQKVICVLFSSFQNLLSSSPCTNQKLKNLWVQFLVFFYAFNTHTPAIVVLKTAGRDYGTVWCINAVWRTRWPKEGDYFWDSLQPCVLLIYVNPFIAVWILSWNAQGYISVFQYKIDQMNITPMYGDTIKHWISIPVSFPFNARNKLDKKKENPCVMTCFDVPQLPDSICVKIKQRRSGCGNTRS